MRAVPMTNMKDEEKEKEDQGQGMPLDESMGNIPDTKEEEINEKFKKLEDQYLRLLADYQNLQKRTKQEKEELYKFASQKTIEALMPALDMFDYARSTINPDSTAEKIVKDFELILDTFLKSLSKIGLEPIEQTGVLFDPFYHEPLQQIPDDNYPNHTVLQILKRGYMLNKKVIRPALVAVSVKSELKDE